MIIVDVEIEKAIPPRGDEPRLAGIDYCLRDVWLEGKMARHILEGGVVYRSPDREHVRPTVPWQVKEAWRLAHEPVAEASSPA